jgi:uncharacterized membrane protein YbhN (UPF0104 family)
LKSAAIRYLPPLLAVLAAFVLWREIHGLTLDQIAAAIAQWSPRRIALALALVITSFSLLALNEQIALRWAGAKVKLTSGLTASFIAHALAINLGLGMLAGGAMRASVFTRYGVNLVQVAKLTAYGTSTFSLGVATLGGLSLLQAGPSATAALNLSPLAGQALGYVLVAVPILYVLACWLAPDGMTVFGHEFRPPRPPIALAQICFGMTDVALGAALFWTLLGPAAPKYTAFLTIYLIGLVSGLVSGVPGGMGVFESAMLLLLPSGNRGALAATLLGFRLFYYILPLAPAMVLLLTRRAPPNPTAASDSETQPN